jgi:hypothetical protein
MTFYSLRRRCYRERRDTFPVSQSAHGLIQRSISLWEASAFTLLPKPRVK